MKTSAVSTPFEPWNRRFPRTREEPWRGPRPAGLFGPPLGAPVGLAADDPPRAKVLVVEDNAPLALELQRLLGGAGYRVVGPAAALADVQRLIDRQTIDGAIVDLDVDRRSPLPVADLLAFADVPFVFLAAGPFADLPAQHRLRPIVDKPSIHDRLIPALERVMSRRADAGNDNRWPAIAGAGATVVPWARVYPQL